MELSHAIKNRRSIRAYTDAPVPAGLIEEIIDEARFAPSWKNTQTARYTFVSDRALLDRIADECMLGFAPNTKTLRGAPALVVLSTRQHIAGYERDGSPTTAQGDHWQSFDAGIAAQTFCLAAYQRGLGTLIMGIFDEDKLAQLIELPPDEKASALIVLGTPAQDPAAPKRKEVADLLRIR